MNNTGFSPEITNYEGTAYSSVNEIRIYPFAKSSTATVKVNGKALVNGYGVVEVKAPGNYPVEVRVSEGGLNTTYHVLVKKVDSDYRDRRAITENSDIMGKLSVKTDFGDPVKLMDILKKNYLVNIPSTTTPNIYVNTDESYWETASPPKDEADSAQLTSFTVDLGDIYSVSRIRAVVGPTNLGPKSRVRISVSTDGVNWETPVTKGNLNVSSKAPQNVIRYEFGVSYKARYIKYEINHWENKTMNLRLYQFMIYYDAGKVQEKEPAPEGGSVPHLNEERHQYLSTGEATVIERGLPLSGWTPSGGYGRGIPTKEEAKQFGYDGPLFYDPDFENKDYMLYNPDALWGIAKAPFGGNSMASAGMPRDFVPGSMKPYINNAISFCFGDEGGYNTQEAKAFGNWFQWTREHYPGVILHSNQYPGEWSEANLREYLKLAKPDMLTWDDYYTDLNNVSVQKKAVRRLLGGNWNLYRKLAYEGLDGTGSKPILFGQYLGLFETDQPLSTKNLIANLSVLSGAKWLNFFRVEYQFAQCYLWDEDGTPTRGLLEWGQIIDRIHAIDDVSNRLNSDWIMIKPGSIAPGGVPSGFRRGDFDSADSAAKNAEYGLKNLSVKSLSNVYGGGTGDVALGYFNTLPGLYESEIAEHFKGATAPKAFMVLNGLIAGSNEFYYQDNIQGRELGSSDNTRQQITITTTPEFADKTLYYVDKDDRDSNGNGTIKKVDRDSSGRFTITLGGGESNLYFWALNTTAKATSQSEGAYASFAFDGHPDTYWMPDAATADQTYEVEKTFAPVSINQVTITEKGSAVRGYQVEYLTANGNWLPFGEAGGEIHAAAQVTVNNAVKAGGIRLKITNAAGIPAIYDISCSDQTVSPGQQHVVTVNDNTMGTGLNRFQYDDRWSYRENEAGGQGFSSEYPLNGDGHFSNFAGSEARFQFYGTKVELLLRASQSANIKAQILDKNGNPVGAPKTGNGRSLIFDNLSQDIYTLLITKINSNQAGFDGARVTYQGALPEYSDEPEKAQQVYLNQRTTNNQLTDYFSYEPKWASVNMAPNSSKDFNVYPDESSKWVEHVQEINSHNCGFTRTNLSGASYTLHFYGTGVQLYSGSLPVNDNAKIPYGSLKFELDGKPIDASYRNVASQDPSAGTNALISLRLAEIDVPNAARNESHALKVTVESGYNRIDYAVVNRFAEASSLINLVTGEHGKAVLESAPAAEGGVAAIRITPDHGYQTADITVNGVPVLVPSDQILVIEHVSDNTTVNITFRKALYKIVLDDAMQGGTVIPDALMAEAGTVITLKPEQDVGYEYKPDSITVSDNLGKKLMLTKTESGAWQFIMPEEGVKITAEFNALPYPILTEKTANGTLTADPPLTASYRQTVTVTVQPDTGYRLKAGSLKASLESGAMLALDEAGNPSERTFLMPAQKVTLRADFEKIPQYTVTADPAAANGSVVIDKPVIAAGDNVTVSFQPGEGYFLGTSYLNQEPWYVPEGDMVLTDIDCDQTITPGFVPADRSFHIGTAKAINETGGTIEPARQRILNKGNAVLVAHPEPGYYAKSVTVKTTKTVRTATQSNAEQCLASGSDAIQMRSAVDSVTNEVTKEITRKYQFPKGSNKIIIPGSTADCEMYVEFAKLLEPVTVARTDNGTLTADSKKAGYGQLVTITVKADQGYRLKGDSLKVVSKNNELQNIDVIKEGNAYTFKMPMTAVSISAQFEADPNPPVELKKLNPSLDMA